MTASAEELLRRAIQVSADAREHGNHPFGAILVAPDGSIALEAENTVVTENDVTGHAETNLVRKAWGTIPHEQLPGYTLYTSCEPCAMCSGAIFWAGIGAVVYGLSEERLIAIAGPGPDVSTLDHPCRTVFAGGSRPTEVTGPLLEDEAAAPHCGFWGSH
ncbi:MAG TPA: nucleoside deaminase [Actinospica sp.]|nr:nucleoside deaminase [Actinospica sp.]